MREGFGHVVHGRSRTYRERRDVLRARRCFCSYRPRACPKTCNFAPLDFAIHGSTIEALVDGRAGRILARATPHNRLRHKNNYSVSPWFVIGGNAANRS
jgi:hypothetical protein